MIATVKQTPVKRKHPLAREDCRACGGTGYVFLERFDMADGEMVLEKQVCQCVLKAVEGRNG